MDVIDFPLCLRQFFPLVFYTALMCISQVCLGRGVCKLFQKGTFACWSYIADFQIDMVSSYIWCDLFCG